MQQSIVLCRLTPHPPPARPCLVPRHQQHTYVPATTPDPSPHKLCSFGVADRGSSIRIPLPVQLKGYGYLEDRRPAASESSLGSTRGARVGRVLMRWWQRGWGTCTHAMWNSLSLPTALPRSAAGSCCSVRPHHPFVLPLLCPLFCLRCGSLHRGALADQDYPAVRCFEPHHAPHTSTWMCKQKPRLCM